MRKQTTKAYYEFGIKKLAAGKSPVAKLRLDQVNSVEVSKLIEWIRDGQGLSNSAVNQALRTLKRALNVAHEQGLIPGVPRFSLPSEQKRTRALSQDEQRQYLKGCEAVCNPWWTIAVIWLELGFRPAEIVLLEPCDVNWQDLEIEIRTGKSTAAKRTLPMTGMVYARLRSYDEQLGRPSTGWLFPSPRDHRKHLNKKRIHDLHKRAMKAAGFPTDKNDPGYFVPYTLRHTFCTELAKQAELPVVAAAAGHSSITITQLYVHPSKQDIRRAIEKKTGERIGEARRRETLQVMGSEGDDLAKGSGELRGVATQVATVKRDGFQLRVADGRRDRLSVSDSR